MKLKESPSTDMPDGRTMPGVPTQKQEKLQLGPDSKSLLANAWGWLWGKRLSKNQVTLIYTLWILAIIIALFS